jgi:tripartite-type tricarboxylate transporter receptor subunit TctC
LGIAVRSDAPWKTFDEFIADAKANPGKISYGTSGAGGTPHITMEQIGKLKGISWTHIPFKGAADSVNALLGGHIHADADGNAWAPMVNSGQFRLLVTWGDTRTKKWPTVPILKEVGINMVVSSPYGLAGPKDMDPTVVKALHDAFKKGMEEPAFLARLDTLDQVPWYLNSEDYRTYALRELGEQKRIVEEFGLKLN